VSEFPYKVSFQFDSDHFHVLFVYADATYSEVGPALVTGTRFGRLPSSSVLQDRRCTIV